MSGDSAGWKVLFLLAIATMGSRVNARRLSKAVIVAVTAVLSINAACKSSKVHGTGFLTVIVEDGTGARVAGADVEIVDDSSLEKKTFKSDPSGVVPPQALKAGSYSVKISSPELGCYGKMKTVAVTRGVGVTLESETRVRVSMSDCGPGRAPVAPPGP